MTDPAAPDDQIISFNFEQFFDSASSEVVPEQDFFQDSFAPVYNSDVPASSPHELVGRSQSFGQQSSTPPGELSVPPGGPRRRAQSDNTPFPSIHFHAATYDTSAVADDDSPSSDLPPIGPHPRQMDAQWAIRDSAQRLSPVSPSPGLLSPWSTGPTSDASSIGSVSPSPSGPGFPSPSLLSDYIAFRAGRSPNPSRHRLQIDDQYVLGEEPPIRGRLARRGKPRRSRNPSVTSEVPFEYLSIQDAPSADGSHHSGYDTSSYPHSPAQSPSFQPWNGDWSTLMAQGADDYPSGSASGSIRSLSSLSQPFESDVLNLPGHSSDAGHSRSYSRAPGVDADVEHLAVLHGHGNSGRMPTRAHRRRHSPYPVAGLSTSLREGGGATGWDGCTNDCMDLSRLGADPSSPSASSLSSWNAGQSSQEDQGAPAYRQSVATPATRLASNRRRKDPTKRGAYICTYCGNDFTALHNLNFHVDSHLSVKKHGCGGCGQRFGTPQVLKRHKRTCPMLVPESPVKKKKKRPT